MGYPENNLTKLEKINLLKINVETILINIALRRLNTKKASFFFWTKNKPLYDKDLKL